MSGFVSRIRTSILLKQTQNRHGVLKAKHCMAAWHHMRWFSTEVVHECHSQLVRFNKAFSIRSSVGIRCVKMGVGGGVQVDKWDLITTI